MVSTKDIVVIAIGTALYVVFTGLSAVTTAVPGFAIVFLATLWLGTLPIWFGIFGVSAVFLGDLIGSVVITGGGFMGVVSAVGSLIGVIPMYFLVFKGSSEIKTIKGLINYLIANAIIIFLIPALIFSFYVLLGFIPAEEAWAIFTITEIVNQPLWAVINTIVMKTITPYIKRTGYYYGTFWERGKKTAQP